MLFGGETLRDFAFALLVGIASGAYSSIFIAAPVLTLWKERESVYVRRRRIVMGDNDGRVPAFDTGAARRPRPGGDRGRPGGLGPAARPARGAAPGGRPTARSPRPRPRGRWLPPRPRRPRPSPRSPTATARPRPRARPAASTSPRPANVKRVPKSKGRKKHGRRR